LDVHARSVVACGLDGTTGQLFERRLSPDYGEILGWVRSLPGPVAVTYEAGPTGFGLARFLIEQGIDCLVAAPSKLQRPAGDRVKTDRRDARHLARLLHLGEIIAVTVPSVEQEAARDLIRAREDVRGDLMRARHRLSKLLLRRASSTASSTTGASRGRHRMICGCAPNAAGHRSRRRGWGCRLIPPTTRCWPPWPGGIGWTRRSPRWPATDTDSAFTPVVVRLGCLRGVSTLTAFGLAVEIGDWRRLSGRSIGAYLGLVPTESSSGDSRSRGSITKTGNGHARRLLIEAAWHHRPRYRIGTELRRRLDRADPAARDRGQRANRRLHARWAAFDARLKLPVIANTAIARELAGWCWSLAVLED
jgi:transposase